MASAKNDALRERTVEGPVNLYDKQRCQGTAANKATAARLSGHSYNILSNGRRDEVYLQELRNDDHYIDRNNQATEDWWPRRRKFAARQPENAVGKAMQGHPLPHPKVADRSARRQEIKLAQIENHQNFSDFQKRRKEFRPDHSPERRWNLNDAAGSVRIIILFPVRIFRRSAYVIR